jgi:uncharacterized membrane protein
MKALGRIPPEQGIAAMNSINIAVIPLNLKLAGMQPEQAVAFWPQYVETWMMWNNVRTAASLLAPALLVVSLVMK